MSQYIINYSRTENGQSFGGCLNVHSVNVELVRTMFLDAGYDTVNITQVEQESAPAPIPVADDSDIVHIPDMPETPELHNPSVGTEVVHAHFGRGIVITPEHPAYLYVQFGSMVRRFNQHTNRLYALS